MKQFVLNLIKNNSRPVVELKNYNNLRALLDTGADFPIWVASEETLVQELGAKLVMSGAGFSGFGGKTTGNVYQLPMLCVGDLTFPYMHIMACKDLGHIPFQLILSASMFHDLIYEIDDKSHKLNIKVPDGESEIRNLKIIDKNGKVHVLCTGEKLSTNRMLN